MKKYILYVLLTVIMITTVIVSCKKSIPSESPTNTTKVEETYQARETSGEFELNTPFVPVTTLLEIVHDLKNEEGSGIIEDSALIEIVLNPLIENGRLLHEELISNISESEEWLLMSEDERDSIINITDQQRAQLSYIYALSNPDIEVQAVDAGINFDILRDCMGVALGIAGIKSLMTNLVTGPTVKTAIATLKWVGKRYLGYIGIVWMIWDFVDCVSHFTED